eukprot:m.16447 g.16447  ORF g.16447 m.16447 type:complete len:151 (+) comp7077_c0_seq2:53-505(+)
MSHSCCLCLKIIARSLHSTQAIAMAGAQEIRSHCQYSRGTFAVFSGPRNGFLIGEKMMTHVLASEHSSQPEFSFVSAAVKKLQECKWRQHPGIYLEAESKAFYAYFDTAETRDAWMRYFVCKPVQLVKHGVAHGIVNNVQLDTRVLLLLS